MNLKKIFDTSRRQKAKRLVQGNSSKVRSFCILKAENPMGESNSIKGNKELNNQLEKYLRTGHFRYFKIKGKYGNDEHSFIIYNVTLEDAEYIGVLFNQESIIYATLSDNSVEYKYLVKEDNKCNVVETRNEIINANNDKDYFSQIGRNFKFRIPFFEQATEIGDSIDKVCNGKGMAILDEYMNEKKSGHHRWLNRCRLDGSYYKNMIK